MNRYQRIAILYILYMACGQCLFSQNSAVETLSFEDYLSIVKTYHPVVQQGQLLIETGENIVLGAKGGFDPKIQGGLNEKQFKRDPYYSIISMSIDGPSKTGVKFSAG